MYTSPSRAPCLVPPPPLFRLHSLSSPDGFTLNINGAPVALAVGSSTTGTQLTVIASEDDDGYVQIELVTPSVRIFATVVGNSLNLFTAPKVTYRGAVHGLVGFYDGNAANDLTAADLTTVTPTSASSADIFTNFGQTWAVPSAGDSLFVYVDGAAFDDLQEPGVTPTFTPVFANAALEAEANAACLGLDSAALNACLFDVAVANDTSAAAVMVQVCSLSPSLPSSSD